MKPTYFLLGSKELQAQLKKACAEKLAQFRHEVFDSALKIQKKAKDILKGDAWSTGHLANTIVVDLVKGKGGREVEVGATAPYAPYVEFGTKPHFPPFKGEEAIGLEDWARKHGFDSVWPICLHIAKYGTPEKPFLFPAYLAVIDGFLKRTKEILEQ